MNEDMVTYSALKFDESGRPRPGDKAATREESVTCQEPNHHTSAKQQGSQRPQGGADKDSLPSQWLRTTIILGILCLLLSIATGILVSKVTQCDGQQKNLTQQPKVCQGQPTNHQGTPQELSSNRDTQWRDQQEILTQQVENLTQQLKLYQSRSTNHQGTPQELPSNRGDKCPVRWIQSSDSLYLFAAADRTWDQCQSYCSSQSARLLKTESKEEKNFIQQESFLYFDLRQGFTYYLSFWIGLSYDSSSRKWVWMDSTALSSGLLEISVANNQHYPRRACAYIQGGNFKSGDCGETRFCLCEKLKALTRS